MRLFISYARADIRIVDEIARILEKSGHDVWYDRAIAGGQDWWTQILDFIRDADAFIFILSQESVESEYCRQEFEYAEKLRKPIIPILTRARTELKGPFAQYQYVDFTDGITVDSTARLVRSLAAFAGRTSDIVAKDVSSGPRIFLAYSHIDRHFVDGLIKRLRQVYDQKNIWYDGELRGGDIWWGEVLRQIADCDIFIYLLSNESVSSPYCQAEFTEARRLQKRIITVQIRDRTKISSELADIQYVDMKPGADDPSALTTLFATINKQASQISRRRVRPLWIEPTPRPSVPVDPKRRNDILEVDTPNLPNPKPPFIESRPPLNESRAAILTALITALFAILAAIIQLIPNLESVFGSISNSIVALPRNLILASPVVVLITCTLIFTAISSLRWSLGLVISFQIFLFIGLQSSEASLFNSYLFIAVAAVLGFALGRMRILPWIINSIELSQNYSNMVSTTNNISPSPSDFALLLKTRDVFPPYKSTLVMQTIAKQGFTTDKFDRLVPNARRQREYAQISENLAISRLKSVNTVEEILQIIGLQGNILKTQASLQQCVEKVRQVESPLEQTRIYADWLRTQVVAGENITQAIDVMNQVVWQVLESYKGLYWSTYDPLSKIVDNLPENDLATPSEREKVQMHIEWIRSLIKEITDTTNIQIFPLAEADSFRLLSETGEFINSYARTLNYPERERMLTTWISRLQPIEAQMIVWNTIDRTERSLIEHTNPWRIMAKWLVKKLENLQILDRYYLEVVGEQIGDVIRSIEDIKSLSQLDEKLESYVSFDGSYGRMIDDTIRALISIGKDADAAIASMEGSYNRQLALQDAHVKLNQLHNTLQTHYLQQSKKWCDALKKATVIVDGYLKIAESSQQTGYRNPYIAGTPVQPSRAALFKGRMDLADQIVTKLRSGSRPTFVLHGPRRMGKTSFLLQLQNLLPGNFIIAFCDMTKAGADQSDGSFFYYLAQSIYKQVTRQPGGELLPEPTLSQYEKHPYDTFTPWIDEHVLPLIGSRVLFITVDEFELIGQAVITGRLSTKVYENLRYIMQHSQNVSLMFAGVQNLGALGPNANSHFIGAHAIEISYLDEVSAEELIRNPDEKAGRMPDYQQEVISDILKLTHRQPFLLQAICSEIIDIANRDELKEIEASVLEEAVIRVFATYSFYFQNVWESTDTHGQILLKRIAQQPTVLSQTELNAEGVRPLLQRRVICKTPDERYEIEIPLVQRWIAQQIHTPLN